MEEIATDKETIKDLTTRGASAVYPSEDAFAEALASGKRLRVYLGMDATASHLHLGHAGKLAALERFRRAGHETVLLVGDFTATVGDPTDKQAARTTLSSKEVQEHLKTWQEQIGRYLDIHTNENPATIRYNSEWLASLGFSDVLQIASTFTVGQLIERDMFQERIKKEKPIYLHEFLYPLMQGYDSVALDVDVELGGTDQTFNMLAGRTLQRVYNDKEKYVLALELLEDPETGKKLMSKSEGDDIPLTAKPEDMYGAIMALPDTVIIPLLRDATFLSLDEVEEARKQLDAGGNPRDVKMRLAREIVSICHDDTAASRAEAAFVDTFQTGNIPEDVPHIQAQPGDDLADIAVQAGVVSSKSELRRLISQGAVEDMETNTVLKEPTVPGETTLRIGKHRFLRITE